MRKKQTAVMLLLVVPLVLLAACVAATTPGPSSPPTVVIASPTAVPATPTPIAPIWQSLQYAPAPADNPLKGFMPFYDAYGSARQPIANDFPYSMEWFYVPLKNLMNGPDSFTFDTGLEPQLASIASRGHQAAFRVYLDYPGRPSGIPQFLRDGGLTVHAYPFFGNTPDASVSPDYDDPKLAGALESFITALGKRYDGDPRIGFITVGLIGFWGEWHTWPMDGFAKETSLLKAQPSLDVPNWMPSQATQLRILQAFDQAFNTTRLLVRYPAVKPGGRDAEPGFRATYQSVPLHIGYHDDSFAYETAFGRDWYFMGKMEWRGAINKWQTEPIGGELRPEIQLGIWLDPPPVAAEDFNAAVDATHASWLIAHALFTSKTVGGPVYERALAGARRLGYELYVSAVKLPAVHSAGSFSVALRGQNTGVAPFYYDWPIELGVLDASHQLVATWRVPWRLSTLLPASVDHARFDTELNYTTTAPGLGSGNYTLLMRVVNPLPNGRPLKFANATQDLDLQDWLTLGRFEVTP